MEYLDILGFTTKTLLSQKCQNENILFQKLYKMKVITQAIKQTDCVS